MHYYKCQHIGYIRKDCQIKKKQIDEKNDGSLKSTNVVQNCDSDYNDGDMFSFFTLILRFMDFRYGMLVLHDAKQGLV